MIDYQCQGDKDENEEQHVGRCIALHREVEIEIGGKNDKHEHEGKDRARPDENHDTKENKERVPDSEGNCF